MSQNETRTRKDRKMRTYTLRNDFNAGYMDGYTGQGCPQGCSDEYYEGWDAGHADRPVTTDFVDAAKERHDPLGY